MYMYMHVYTVYTLRSLVYIVILFPYGVIPTSNPRT